MQHAGEHKPGPTRRTARKRYVMDFRSMCKKMNMVGFLTRVHSWPLTARWSVLTSARCMLFHSAPSHTVYCAAATLIALVV
jgi:hypothetical protein